MWNGKTITAILAVLFFLGLGFLFFDRKETPRLEFSAILPMTGDNSASGSASRAGLLLAKEDLEKAGVESHIRIFDSKRSSDEALSIMSTIADDNTSQFVFSSFSNVTQVVNPIAFRRKLVIFYDSCNCGFAEENQYSFQFYFDPRLECRLAGEFYKSKGASKVAFLGLDVPYGKYCYENLQQVFGAENVLVEKEAEDLRKDYGALLASFKEEGVGFVISVPAVSDFPALFSANSKSEINLPIVCFDNACLTENIKNNSEEAWLSNIVPFGLSASPYFEERILSLHPDFDHQRIIEAGIAYDSLQYASRALSKCKNIDSECLVEAIKKDKKYKGAIISNGFGDDRVLDYKSVFEDWN